MRSANSDRPPYGPDRKCATGAMSRASARDRWWDGILKCNGLLVVVRPQEGVRVSRGELRDVDWIVRRYPNAQLVATHYQTPIQGPPYPEKELIKRGQRS